MRDAAIRVMELQPDWSDRNTPAMQERGVLIRDVIPEWLRTLEPRLATALGPCGYDFDVEGRDGTGRRWKFPGYVFAQRADPPTRAKGGIASTCFTLSAMGLISVSDTVRLVGKTVNLFLGLMRSWQDW